MVTSEGLESTSRCKTREGSLEIRLQLEDVAIVIEYSEGHQLRLLEIREYQLLKVSYLELLEYPLILAGLFPPHILFENLANAIDFHHLGSQFIGLPLVHKERVLFLHRGQSLNVYVYRAMLNEDALKLFDKLALDYRISLLHLL